MNEDYCSYELSKALKECGFDEPCNYGYSVKLRLEPEVSFGEPKMVHSKGPKNYNDNRKGIEKGLSFCSAVPLWQAQKWLREKKDIVITIDFCPIDDSSMIYTYTINRYNPDGGKNIGDCWEVYCSLCGCGCCYSGGWDFYEEALSAGIAAALEMLHLPFTKQKQ